MTSTSPLISVVIPTYNNARYVRQAVDSVFAQTYPYHEVIVVDDGSMDDPEAVLSSCLKRIQFVRQQNQGPSAARNRGLEFARGEFVVFLDSDDYLLLQKFERQLACFKADPMLGVVHSGWRLVDADGSPLRDVEPWHNVPKLNLKGWVFWKPVFMGAMLCRREWLDRVGPFNIQLCQAEDVDLLLRLAFLGCRMKWLREPTICRRKHRGNITHNAQRQVLDLSAVLDAFFARPGIPWTLRCDERRVRYSTQVWLAWYVYRAGDTTGAIVCLRRARSYLPTWPTPEVVCDWVRQFTRHDQREEMTGDDGEAQMQLFRLAASMPNDQWVTLEARLRWWRSVWRLYEEGDRDKAAAALLTMQVPAVSLKALAQDLLIGFSPDQMLSATRDLWADATRLGLVPEESRHEVVGLYLKVMGQAALSGYWLTALRALAAALNAGAWHPQSWAAWYLFFRKGLDYALGGVSGACTARRDAQRGEE
jgi:glycosyltransferase involved in cell wall biosynthesis